MTTEMKKNLAASRLAKANSPVSLMPRNSRKGRFSTSRRMRLVNGRVDFTCSVKVALRVPKNAPVMPRAINTPNMIPAYRYVSRWESSTTSWRKLISTGQPDVAANGHTRCDNGPDHGSHFASPFQFYTVASRLLHKSTRVFNRLFHVYLV